MTWLLHRLGYAVKVKKDLTGAEILRAVSDFAVNHDRGRPVNSAVVVILSHGVDGIDGSFVSVGVITGTLDGTRCKNLRGKPKLFIIQACRGAKIDTGVSGNSGPRHDNSQPVFNGSMALQEHQKISTPSRADTLICLSTIPGYVSWRDQRRGSWFIQAICRVFADNAEHDDVLTMMTKVK